MSGNLAFRRKSIHQRQQVNFSLTKKNDKFDKWKRNTNLISKEILFSLYAEKKKSMQETANILHCSLHKVSYWMRKYKFETRPRSEAMYVKHNPQGDPFEFKYPSTINEGILYGLGLGLYWGEGNKTNLNSIRLGNTDPKLIDKFIEFLLTFFRIEKSDLKFGLQIFTDIDPKLAMDFWVKQLKINKSQFNKPIVTRSNSLGTYKKKSQYGVLTVMYHNTKLRNLIISLLPM